MSVWALIAAIGFILVASVYAFLILFISDQAGVATVKWPWIKTSEIHRTDPRQTGPGIDIDLSEKILSSAILIRDFRDSHRLIGRIEQARPQGASEKSAEFERALKDAQDQESFTYGIYHLHLEQTAEKYSPKDLTQALALLKARFGSDDAFKPLSKIADLFVEQTAAYRQNNGLDEKKIKQGMLKDLKNN